MEISISNTNETLQLKTVNYWNPESAKKMIPGKITQYRDGKFIAYYTNHPTTNSNRPSHYKKGKKAWNTPDNWNRDSKRAHETVDNFVEKDCWFLTLLIKDKRIKKIETVTQLLREYTKGLSSKSYWLSVIEYDCKGHPHVHMILENKNITKNELEAKWKYGFSCIEKARTLHHLVDYLIKTYALNEDMTYNPQEAWFDTYFLKAINRKIKHLEKQRNHAKSNQKKEELNLQIGKLISYRNYELKPKLKKNLQKQVKRNPLVTSYGKPKPDVILNENKEPLNKIIPDNKKYQISKYSERKLIDNKTGEIKFSQVNTEAVYK